MAKMNLADLTDRLSGNGMPKEERYKWVRDDDRGVEMQISKHDIKIDPTYQRVDGGLSQSRVESIVRNWSWVAFAVLVIARRADGTYWVIDGQHRLIAAMKRSDIDLLPCRVFEHIDIRSEAAAFGKVNTNRGPMSGFDKFRASVIAQDDVALKVKDMVEEYGYNVARGTGSQFSVSCVQVLQNCFRISEATCRGVWDLCAQLHVGEPVIDRVFAGLFHLERAMSRMDPPRTILSGPDRAAVLARTVDDIKNSIAKSAHYYGKGGAKIWARGIADLLNHKRRAKNRIELSGAGED